MVKAIRMHTQGGPEVMKLEEVDLAAPAAGQIQVKHTAIGLNYIDTYHRSGLYKLELPSGLGMEGAGTVAAVGDGVTSLKVGDRIAYAAPPPGSRVASTQESECGVVLRSVCWVYAASARAHPAVRREGCSRGTSRERGVL